MMRYLAIVLATLVLAACATSTNNSAVDPQAVEELLTAAATDFHAHRPPDPARFRDVRAGQVPAPDGKPQYLLCGQFLPRQDGATWTRFATIKTSGYEQWLGNEADVLCQRSTITWDRAVDYASVLQQRFDSLKP